MARNPEPGRVADGQGRFLGLRGAAAVDGERIFIQQIL